MMPEWMIYLRAAFALIFVLGLIFCCAALARKYGLDKRFSGGKQAIRRLSIVETLYLDPKHRLIIIRADAKEHLLLLGASGNRVIESHEANET